MQRLVERLGSHELAIRYSAASALIGYGTACVPLLHALLEQQTWDQRQLEAISVLNRLGDQCSAPVLHRALSRDLEHERLAVLRGLRGLCGDQSCFLDALEDPAWEIRREAVFALCDLRQPQLRFIVASMAQDPHPLVRGAAINGLGILGTQGDLDLEIVIANALEDRSEWVRSMAAWSVRHLKRHR
ncbi:MAG: HEAT repeat domain-containing protein [Desulfocurvibacter africanus]